MPDMNLKIALLMVLIFGYILISVYIAWLRQRLRKRVDKLSSKELSSFSQNNLHLLRHKTTSDPTPQQVTTFVGIILVNVPIIPVMVGPLIISQEVFNVYSPTVSALILALSFLSAWAWWSAGVTVWRWWATTRRGMPPDQVQLRGEEAFILWPKNHFLEKTELGKLLSRYKSN